METWKDIPGFEGLYQVSDKGRIKSYKKDPDGLLLKLTNRRGDYFRIVLQGKGKQMKSKSLHRLVAEAFIPNPDNLPQVNHKDGNKQNNRVENLEWCTAAENVRHSLAMHPDQVAAMCYYNQRERPDPILQMTTTGDVIAWFDNGADAARATGVCQRNIMQVANRTPFKPGHPRKTAGGYVWRFAREVMQK